jgi:short-subunit dehydrogenase
MKPEPIFRTLLQRALTLWRDTKPRTRARDLEGKVVVVTGGSSGNGRAIALECAARGAKIVIAARGTERLAEVALEIEALGAEVLRVPTDVTKPEAVERLAKESLERFSKIDVWVNNVGAAFFSKLDQAPSELREWLLDVNVRSVIHGTQTAVAVMRHQGFGHLINMASVAGRVAFPRMGFYSATKAFVEVYTQALRQELMHLERTGILVSVVQPVAVRTPFFDAAPNESQGRPGGYLIAPTLEPDDVGSAVADAIVRYRPVILPFKGAKSFALLYDLLPGVADRVYAQLRPDEPEGPLTSRTKGSHRVRAPMNPQVQYGTLEHVRGEWRRSRVRRVLAPFFSCASESTRIPLKAKLYFKNLT